MSQLQMSSACVGLISLSEMSVYFFKLIFKVLMSWIKTEAPHHLVVFCNGWSTNLFQCFFHMYVWMAVTSQTYDFWPAALTRSCHTYSASDKTQTNGSNQPWRLSVQRAHACAFMWVSVWTGQHHLYCLFGAGASPSEGGPCGRVQTWGFLSALWWWPSAFSLWVWAVRRAEGDPALLTNRDANNYECLLWNMQ